eukprot:TRINITY_DN70735_c0_g1_i1.p1 TRINITY_DN70735_c0_g1~~TRINITY_DN70735_c0_g1_i1.p1  ORF type:complete len:739 (+),score=158.11 TRINITY_DN70735_c0_g1_i1:93-2219(+)
MPRAPAAAALLCITAAGAEVDQASIAFAAQCDTKLSCTCASTSAGHLCRVQCAQDNNYCYGMTLDCHGKCLVECTASGGLAPCTGLSVNCLSGDCAVLCTGMYSCSQALLACPSGRSSGCGILCGGYGSCPGAQLSGRGAVSCSGSDRGAAACSAALRDADKGSCAALPEPGPFARLVHCRAPVASGDKCREVCPQSLLGGGTVHCAGGTWLDMATTCLSAAAEQSCQGLPGRISGDAVVSCPSWIDGATPAPAGTTCNVTCPSGQVGGGSITCISTQWHNGAVPCSASTAAVCDGLPPAPDTGWPSCTPPLQSGELCPLRCPEGQSGGGGWVCADGAYVYAGSPCKPQAEQQVQCSAAPDYGDGTLQPCPLPAGPGAVCTALCNGNTTAHRNQSTFVCLGGQWRHRGGTACPSSELEVLGIQLSRTAAICAACGGLLLLAAAGYGVLRCCDQGETQLSDEESEGEAELDTTARPQNPLREKERSPRRLGVRTLDPTLIAGSKPSRSRKTDSPQVAVAGAPLMAQDYGSFGGPSSQQQPRKQKASPERRRTAADIIASVRTPKKEPLHDPLRRGSGVSEPGYAGHLPSTSFVERQQIEQKLQQMKAALEAPVPADLPEGDAGQESRSPRAAGEASGSARAPAGRSDPRPPLPPPAQPDGGKKRAGRRTGSPSPLPRVAGISPTPGRSTGSSPVTTSASPGSPAPKAFR